MKMYLICIFASFIILVHGWSTFDRTDKSYVRHKLNKSPDYNYYKNAGKLFKACKDKSDLCLKVSKSKSYQKYCADETIEKICKRTCGNCPAVSPLSCHASAQGCCWDNITKVASGCPDCVDRSYACQKISKRCPSAHIARICPQTCNVCPSVVPCFDDPQQIEYCPYWKDAGMCTSEKDLMLQYCSKTCDLCALTANQNDVIQVFRKGSESELSDEEKLTSEKDLIKMLLENKKKREVADAKKEPSNEIDKKKKEVEAENDVVATVINDNKEDKKENKMSDKAAVHKKNAVDESFEALIKLMHQERMKKRLVVDKKSNENKKSQNSDGSFEALVKLFKTYDKKSTTAKKEAQDKGKMSDEDFNAIMGALSDSKKKSVKKEADESDQKKKEAGEALLKLLKKKETEVQTAMTKKVNVLDENKRQEANKKLLELISKKESEKNTEKKELQNKIDDAMFNMIKEDASKNNQQKKSAKEEIAEILKKEDSAAKSANKIPKELAKRYLMELILDEKEATRKRAENSSEKDAVEDALFDLLKQQVESEQKKKDSKQDKALDELVKLMLS